MPLKQRILFYLYGAPHVVGSVLALLALGAFFAGVIGKLWYLIVPGLYVAGVLMMPRSSAALVKLNQQAGVEEIHRALDEILKTLRGHVADVIYNHVTSIVDSIKEVLPLIKDSSDANHASFTVREMALSYLPETLDNYLRLPRAYARFHPVHNGKTSRELLLEQLAVLDAELKQVVDDIARDNVNSLEAHGRFLKKRFTRSDTFWN